MKTRLTSLAKAALPIVAGALAFTATPDVKASPLIEESFNSPLGSLPLGWSSPVDTNYVRIATHNGRNWLEMRRNTNSWNETTAFYNPSPSNGPTLPALQPADFTASVVLNTGNLYAPGAMKTSTSFGMVVRSTGPNFAIDSSSYYIGVVAVGGGSGLYIWNNVTNHVPSTTTYLAFDGFDAITANGDFRLEVTALGSDLSATLWSLDTNGDDLLALASTSISNASVDGGYLGLRTGFANTNTQVYFRDLEVTAIPEPATALLLLPAAAIVLYRKRRGA